MSTISEALWGSERREITSIVGDETELQGEKELYFQYQVDLSRREVGIPDRGGACGAPAVLYGQRERPEQECGRGAPTFQASPPFLSSQS